MIHPATLLGPVRLYSSIVLRDIGFDSNIHNDADAPKQDFTLTARGAVPGDGPAGAAQPRQRRRMCGGEVGLHALTTVSVEVELQRDRFDASTVRDADSVLVMPAVEFAPDAVIAGRAAAGFKRFNPRDPRVKAFRGLVGSANMAYILLGGSTSKLLVM
jgi:hypothetical protein